MARATAKKVRDEGHWIAMMDGRPATNFKHTTPQAAIYEARCALVEHFQLRLGEERLVSEIAKELEVPRYMIEDIPDVRDGYYLHVADGIGGGIYERPKKDWTLFRDDES